MSGRNIVLDTNILIYLSKKQLEPEKIFIDNANYFISIITKIELLGYSFKNDEEFNLSNDLVETLNIIPLSDEIADLTINLRRKYSIKIPDAIIYASSQHIEGILYTNNISDFERLTESVELNNPFR